MIRHVWALITILFCSVGSRTIAHEVSQMFLKIRFADDGHFLAEMAYDAGYALPEMRTDREAPQPKRDWLLEQPPEKRKALQEGAEAFLRECIAIVGEGESATPIEWTAEFPDFKSNPPDFPTMPDGGAYFRIHMKSNTDQKIDSDLSFQVREGENRPTFVVMLQDGTERLLITAPGAETPIWTMPASATPPAVTTEKAVPSIRFSKWISAAAFVILLVFALSTVWKKIAGESPED